MKILSRRLDGRLPLLALALAAACAHAEPGLTPHVNPMIGTQLSKLPHTIQTGNTSPAASLAHGMLQWGPQTPRPPRTPAGYYYDAGAITGFPLTNVSGAGCGSAGALPVLPTSDAGQAQASFSHANEEAAPGYYSVRFDNGIRTELTATLRSGLGRFSFVAGQDALLVLDASRSSNLSNVAQAAITPLPSGAVSGMTTLGNFCESRWTEPLYFYAQFDQPYTVASNAGGRAVLRFASGARVLMKVGISYVSAANAQENLERENRGWDFDALRQAADASWNARLRAIEVEGGTPEQLGKFYTALYHTLWGPTLYSDANGQYRGLDGQAHTLKAGQGAQYTNFSGWDIYRSLIPLQALLAPAETGDMAQSLVNDAEQCGALPSWVNGSVETGVMPGSPGVLIVAQAYQFGARGFDAAGALRQVRKLSNVAGTACNRVVTTPGKASYLKYGYIAQGEWEEASAPADRTWVFCKKRSEFKNRCNADGEIGPASSTLEYTSSDFAAAQLARAMGDQRGYKQWLARSAAWRMLMAPGAAPLLTARYADGSWADPADRRNYVEGSAEQYTWMVPYDGAGLVRELGGAAAVSARLDRYFGELNAGTELPFHYMGNETGFQVPWLYNWTGAPSSAQAVVRRIMDSTFTAGPDGLPGNDDLGALSGWYVWAALGLYPQIPAVPGLAVSSPQFRRIVLHMGNGRKLTIRAEGAPQHQYIQGVTLNGKRVDRPWLDLASLHLEGGAVLDVAMGAQPSSWGAGAAPPSFGVPPADGMADAANDQGIGVDGQSSDDGAGADFDGERHAYSTRALAAAGARAGRPFLFGGARFVWPKRGLDNAVAVGQTIALARPGKARRLVLLAAANDGPGEGELVLHYADGGSVTRTVKVDDWTLNGGNSEASAPVALRGAYRLGANGKAEAVPTYVFGISVALDPGRKLVGVQLPQRVTAGRIHIFGLELAR